MANATEQLISIESPCGDLLILTTESAGGVYGAIEEVETWANIGRLQAFYLHDDSTLVIGKTDAKNGALVVAYVDFLG